ncbi:MULTISPECIES: ABC transporter permease [Cryobacterium]|uniref:ABC transporter permease subunit n=1 Tax=Cryobacterium levicorallinum TaxID=995038 RepID=A0A1I2ZJC3_9MICO|nr:MULTISPECIES: ABC transporter permease subunit [Cryobacterium]TFB89497.1 ABC transporter permease subunit [Cryobacterium levicorallinum]TFD56662.1 ABC transporter permease subunit [Cryobacterium sp. Hh38]GEP25832.1 nitrate ABC transporter permease [Cryobacterium levicorallinum]SFH37765.1 ABC-type nitrate/sulfonate/bicarbonate transport system, permease component [Cryobacterium levicorallinum]
MSTRLDVVPAVGVEASAFTPVPRRRFRARGRVTNVLLGCAGLLSVALVAQFLAPLGIVREQDLPPTTVIMAALAGLLGESTMWMAVYDTIYVWAIGLAVASVAGVVVGILLGSIEPLRRATSSTVEFLRPIPSVALVPLVVLVFGPRYESALVLVIYAAFWQVLVQTVYGVADVDPVVADTARSYRFSRWGVMRYVIWPTALPFVMTGIRLAATVALVLTVTAQLIIGTPGLGQSIAQAESGGANARMYALVLITGLLGLAVNIVVRLVEKRVLAWHMSFRKDASE